MAAALLFNSQPAPAQTQAFLDRFSSPFHSFGFLNLGEVPFLNSFALLSRTFGPHLVAGLSLWNLRQANLLQLSLKKDNTSKPNIFLKGWGSVSG